MPRPKLSNTSPRIPLKFFIDARALVLIASQPESWRSTISGYANRNKIWMIMLKTIITSTNTINPRKNAGGGDWSRWYGSFGKVAMVNAKKINQEGTITIMIGTVWIAAATRPGTK